MLFSKLFPGRYLRYNEYPLNHNEYTHNLPQKSTNTMALGDDGNTCKYASIKNTIALAATSKPNACRTTFLFVFIGEERLK